jgi:hypothetical protein
VVLGRIECVGLLVHAIDLQQSLQAIVLLLHAEPQWLQVNGIGYQVWVTRVYLSASVQCQYVVVLMLPLWC